MLVAGDFRGGRSPVRHGDDNTGAASPHADVGRGSRHALLAGFLAGPGKGLSPFAGEQGQRLIASIARHNKISADRVQKHYCAYLRAYMAITDHLIHPGTETIN